MTLKPHVQRRRIDGFTRFLVLEEQKNRRLGKPRFKQAVVRHKCGTPACVGGYLNTYPPYRRAGAANPGLDWFPGGIDSIPSQPGYLHGLKDPWNAHFSGSNPATVNRTALQAANALRKDVGLKPFRYIKDAERT